ncbi:hypothetical protein CDAR_405191 [Caerostris darwini]|uniref:Uncharacterized protein n=1 Tax=Caerostris darwini TaxID=1538125 RepID=A0AAV4U6U9_9ARAC|nr:hypothetical protein CDAR_405191 [Caerostris darwini]
MPEAIRIGSVWKCFSLFHAPRFCLLSGGELFLKSQAFLGLGKILHFCKPICIHKQRREIERCSKAHGDISANTRLTVFPFGGETDDRGRFRGANPARVHETKVVSDARGHRDGIGVEVLSREKYPTFPNPFAFINSGKLEKRTETSLQTGWMLNHSFKCNSPLAGKRIPVDDLGEPTLRESMKLRLSQMSEAIGMGWVWKCSSLFMHLVLSSVRSKEILWPPIQNEKRISTFKTRE